MGVASETDLLTKALKSKQAAANARFGAPTEVINYDAVPKEWKPTGRPVAARAREMLGMDMPKAQTPDPTRVAAAAKGLPGSETIDYSKTAIPGETPADTRLRNNPQLGEPKVQAAIEKANAIGSKVPPPAAPPAAPAPVEAAAKGKFGQAVSTLKGLPGRAGGALGTLALPLAAGAEALNVAERAQMPGAIQNEEIAAGATRLGAALAAYGGASAAVPPAPGVLGLVRPAVGLAAGAAAYSGVDKLWQTPGNAAPGISPQTPGMTGVGAVDSLPVPSAEFAANPQKAVDDAKAAAGIPAAPRGVAPTVAAPTPDQELRAAQAPVLTKMGVSATDQAKPEFGGGGEMRRAIVQANRPDTEFHKLGDYDAPGTQIFGRSTKPGGKINDFVGVGGGQKVPDSGVNFGFKPGEVAAYTASKEAAKAEEAARFGAAQAPQYQVSPAVQKINAEIERVTGELAGLKGGFGSKRLGRQLDKLISAGNALSNADDKNFAGAQFAFGHAQRAESDRQTRLSGERSAAGANAVAQAKVDADWKVKVQEAKDKRVENEKAMGKERMGGLEKMIAARAGEDKNLANQLLTQLHTQTFAGPDGKPMKLKDFPEGTESMVLDQLLATAIPNAAVAANGYLPASDGTNTTAPASFGQRFTEIARSPSRALEMLNLGNTFTSVNDGQAVVNNNKLGSRGALKKITDRKEP